MAQTLRYVDELLANFPDNSSGLIDAVHTRDFVASFANGRGYVIDESPVALVITDGVYLAINPLLLSPVTVDSLWSFDGNNFVFPNHSEIPATVVPSGYSKLASFTGVLDLTKATGGADTYQVTYTKNGVPVGLPETVVFPNTSSQTVTVIHAAVVDVSVTSDLFGMSIQGVGTGDDLTLEYFSMFVEDSILVSSP